MKGRKTPFLSVLLCVYNGCDLIETAIKSVIEQPCRDLELIIMDDGSTDNTLGLCKAYAEKDDRIKCFSHPNVGLGSNRNQGFEKISGKWTIFLDHDDMLLPGFYTEDLRRFLDECEKKRIETIVPSRIVMDYQGEKAKRDHINDFGIVEGCRYAWELPYEFATIIYHTGLLRKNNIKFHEQRIEMESIFRLKAVYMSPRTLFIDDFYFAVRRNNPQSISHKWNVEVALKTRFESYEGLKKWFAVNYPDDKESQIKCDERLYGIINEYLDWAIETGTDIRKKIKVSPIKEYADRLFCLGRNHHGIKYLLYVLNPSFCSTLVGLRKRKVIREERYDKNMTFFVDNVDFQEVFEKKSKEMIGIG